MNLFGNQKPVSDGTSDLTYLLDMGVTATTVLEELNAYLSTDVKKEFVQHFIKMYDIQDSVKVADAASDKVENLEELNSRAEKVERYTEDLFALVEDGVASSVTIVNLTDECCSDQVPDIIASICDKYNINCEGKYDSLLQFIVDNDIEFPEVVRLLNEILPEEDRLVIVDSAVGY